MRDRLRRLTHDLMLIPGLSGYEGRVRRFIAARLQELGLVPRTDRVGNLIATIDGRHTGPTVMVFAHMDQIGFVVRKVETSGLIRLERLGGVPEKALPSLPVLFCIGEGYDRLGLIANKSHHATTPDEKYHVLPYAELFADVGLEDAQAVHNAGIDIGTPVIFEPKVMQLGEHRIAGTSVDDRAACAVMLEVASALLQGGNHPKVHMVFSVQEEFNLRGALVAAQALSPDIAIQLDLILATDTPDMQTRGECALGRGPAMAMYSFHGRGTLNGTIPHPALVRLFSQTAAASGTPLQRSAHLGALTDSSYVQLVNEGVACIDLGFATRYTHSSLEMCDVRDLEGLTQLLISGLRRINTEFNLDRDLYVQ
jgi:putative aminopeptidase FrvX